METNNDGALLAEVIRRRNTNISELCRKIKVNRRTLYNWFKKERLSPDVICKIGIVIHYDFSKEFDTEFLQNGIQHLNQASVADQLLDKSVAYWQNKYESLINDYAALSDSKITRDNSILPKNSRVFLNQK